MIQLFINQDKKESHRFTVRDKQGQILFLIQGNWGREGDSVNLFSLDANLLLQAKQVNMSPFFKFDLFHKQKKLGAFRKHPGFFGLRDAFFTVQPYDWIIRGDFEKLDFTAFEKEQEIFKVSKLLKYGNALYSLKVKREEDIQLASLLSILLDHYSRKKQGDRAYQEVNEGQYNLGFLNYRIHSKLFLNLDKEKLVNKK